MKNFTKLIPVALGLLMLSSCSNDDFFSEDQAKQDFTANLGKGDLLVTAPEFEIANSNALTRALRDWEPEDENWKPVYLFTEKDRIRVYDGTLTNYDFYAYSAVEPGNAQGGNKKYAFRLMYDEPNLDGTAKYALYPGEDVIRGGWEFNEKLNLDEHYMDNHTHGWIKVDIAKDQKYWADYSRILDPENTTPLYQDKLPTWGKVESTDAGYVKTDLEYLTGMLVWETTGTPKYAKYMKVQLYDKNKEEYLPIAGRFETDLVKNKILQLAYKKVIDPKTGKEVEVVDEAKTARIRYTDVITADKANLKDGDPAPANEIIVDLSGNIGLEAKDSKIAKVFVPLVSTEGAFNADGTRTGDTEVDIIVSTSDDKIKWTEDWRLSDQVIERGKAYYKDATSHMEFRGTTICALTDLLATLAAEAQDGETLEVVATQPIEITDECNQLLIPNKKINLTIDLSKGVYSNKENQTLRVKYASTSEGQPVPTSVTFIGKRYGQTHGFGMDVKLPKTIFDLVNIPYADEPDAPTPAHIGKAPVNSLKLDANSFILGDGKLAATLDADKLNISDNVKSLTVDKLAKLDYKESAGGTYPCASISIPNNAGEEGYKSAGIEEVTVNGIMNCGIDAHTSVVNITVKGTDKYATLAGEIRTQGTVSALDKALILPATCGSRGVAAFGKVLVTGQSFIAGSIFSKDAEGGIDIQNTDFNPNALLSAGGGLLSDVIYETFTDDETVKKVIDLMKKGYGPLYAEEGSVKIQAINSELAINKQTLKDVTTPTQYTWILEQLNEHADKTVEYNVYAKKNIDLLGTKITATGSHMWAEFDAHIGGTSIENPGEVLVNADADSKGGDIKADHDLAVIGKSYVNKAEVGRNATVHVLDRDGKGNYEAIDILKFNEYVDEKQPVNSGNTLFLNQGYVRDLENGTADEPVTVKLTHYSQPAFSAVGIATVPDEVIPTNISKWNGKQIAASLKGRYVGKNLWTATQLAAQLTGLSTVADDNELILRSDIDLMNNPWTGISAGDKGFTLIGKRYDMTKNDRRDVKNLQIVGGDNSGFVGLAESALTVKNIKFDGVSTKLNAISGGELKNVGGVAGMVGGKFTLDNVAVVLAAAEDGEKANFGSNGTTNLKASQIGGLAGLVAGDAELTACRVNATNAIFNGWHSMGGLLGQVNGNLTIKDADALNEFGATTGYVNGFTANITYWDINPPIINLDLNQGKTGLYVGTLGDVVNKKTKINMTADQYNEKFTVTGKVKEDAATWEGTYNDPVSGANLNGQYHFARAKQTLIGQSGQVQNGSNAVLINNKPFYIKKFGNNGTPDMEDALYLLFFTGGANGNQQQP